MAIFSNGKATVAKATFAERLSNKRFMSNLEKFIK